MNNANLLMAYLQQVAPELSKKDHPIRRSDHGYVTTTSPYSDVGQYEIDEAEDVIIHRIAEIVYVGSAYEKVIQIVRHHIERRDDRAIIH